MKFKILGLQEINFTNKDSGEVIDGVKLHLVTDYEEDYVHGHSVTTQFLSKKRFLSKAHFGHADQLIGKNINLEYNQKGKVGDFDILDTPTK